MKRNIHIITLASMLLLSFYSNAFSAETPIYSYEFIPTESKILIEKGSDNYNYFFIHNYDFNNILYNNNIEKFELTLNFNNFNELNEDWSSQVMVGSIPDKSFGESLDSFSSDLILLFDINAYSLNKTFNFDIKDSWFSMVASSGIFTLALLESTKDTGQTKDSITLNSAKLEIFGSTKPVPIPGAALLLGSGLLGIVAIRQRRTT